MLTVGDALASQLPALLVSAASGIVVTRSATGEQLGRAFGKQLLARRRPVIMTAGILTVLGLMPGMPLIPCWALAGMLFAVSRRAEKRTVATPGPGTEPASDKKKSTAEEVDAALAMDLLALEVGYELVVDRGRQPWGNASRTNGRSPAAGRRATSASSFLPSTSATTCSCRREGIGSSSSATRSAAATAKQAASWPSHPGAAAPPLEGERTTDPTFGMPATWIAPRDKELAEALGYMVVDHATIVATHLGELLRHNAHKLLGRQEVQHLLDLLARDRSEARRRRGSELAPTGRRGPRYSQPGPRRGLDPRHAHHPRVARPSSSVQTKDVEQLTELVRERLAPHITSRLRGPDGTVTALTLDPRLEEMLRKSLRDIATGAGGALDPEMLRLLTGNAERAVAKLGASGTPCIVAAPDLRRYVRAIFERKLPERPRRLVP